MIEKLEALNRARTRGPWRFAERLTWDGLGDRIWFDSPEGEVWINSKWQNRSKANDEFIVAMANCADEILAVLELTRQFARCSDPSYTTDWGFKGPSEDCKRCYGCKLRYEFKALEAKIAKECGG